MLTEALDKTYPVWASARGGSGLSGPVRRAGPSWPGYRLGAVAQRTAESDLRLTRLLLFNTTTHQSWVSAPPVQAAASPSPGLHALRCDHCQQGGGTERHSANLPDYPTGRLPTATPTSEDVLTWGLRDSSIPTAGRTLKHASKQLPWPWGHTCKHTPGCKHAHTWLACYCT